ncbi:MAG: hypothetical protein ACPGRD_07180 [Planktomarina sp.]
MFWTQHLAWGKARAMSDKPAPKRNVKDQGREARLKAALKANMGRRKAQARARAANDADPKTDAKGT